MAKRKADAGDIDVTTIANPLDSVGENAVVKSVAQETAEIIKVEQGLQSLAEKQELLEQAREHFQVNSRLHDITTIKKLDDLTDGMMTVLTKNMEKLDNAMQICLTKGDMKGYKDAVSALGIVIEKRNQLLGIFDPDRKKGGNNKKIKLALKWGKDGGQAAAEVSDE